MIWLTWRQFRTQALSTLGVVVVLGIYLVTLGLQIRTETGYQLPADLEAVLAGSHGVDHNGVRAAFEASLTTQGLGVDARRVDGRIVFTYPIAAFACAVTK